MIVNNIDLATYSKDTIQMVLEEMKRGNIMSR